MRADDLYMSPVKQVDNPSCKGHFGAHHNQVDCFPQHELTDGDKIPTGVQGQALRLGFSGDSCISRGAEDFVDSL